MLERAISTMVVLVAIAAAVALAVFAAGFALDALLLTWLTPAGAAACVAAAAALCAALTALILRAQERHRALMEEVERARAAQAAPAQPAASPLGAEGPAEIADWLSEHPLLTLGISAVSGFLATRHPGLAGEIIAALRSRPR
jgi:hypothetical protein